MKKFFVIALFGLAGLAAFAGTCTITHVSLVSTDGTHKTFAGQLDNTSGVNILQHNFVVAFIDSGNNLVETKSVSGCLNSVQNNTSDFFSAVSATGSSGVSVGLARIAFDGSFKVGTTSAQNVSITAVTGVRATTTLTVAGTVKNNSATTLDNPNVCIVVRTSAGNVLITAKTGLSNLAQNATGTFSVTMTVPDDSTASTVDVWVDGLDSSSNPTTPQSNTGTAVTSGSNKLTWTTEPEDKTGGIVFTSQPVITLQNAAGATLTTNTDSVTLAIASGPTGGVLTCTTNPKAAVAGIATFAGCSLDKAGTYVLRASATGFTSADSTNIVITVGAAAKFGFTTQPPASTVSMTGFGAVVSLMDAGGNLVTSGAHSTDVVALAISTNPGGGMLTGCTIPPAVAGVATITGCMIDKVGTGYVLRSSATGLTDATSAAFNITVGAAAALILNQPTGAASGVAFATQPNVTVVDAGGNTVGTSTLIITLTVSAGGTLTCTANSVAAVAGVATFAGCNITPAGMYTIHAASGALFDDTATITITP